MTPEREWSWQNATGRSTPDDAARLLARQRDDIQQKEAQILALADALESMTYIAGGLYAASRRRDTSNGSHEQVFANAHALVAKARSK